MPPVTAATGTAERESAVAMVGETPAGSRVTPGADKAYDTSDFVAEMRRMGVAPHVARNNNGSRSAIDGRTTRHAGCGVSVRVRKRIEEVFGWTKTVGGMRKTRHRGTEKVGWVFTLTAAAYNLARLPKLLGAATLSERRNLLEITASPVPDCRLLRDLSRPGQGGTTEPSRPGKLHPEP